MTCSAFVFGASDTVSTCKVPLSRRIAGAHTNRQVPAPVTSRCTPMRFIKASVHNSGLFHTLLGLKAAQIAQKDGCLTRSPQKQGSYSLTLCMHVRHIASLALAGSGAPRLARRRIEREQRCARPLRRAPRYRRGRRGRPWCRQWQRRQWHIHCHQRFRHAAARGRAGARGARGRRLSALWSSGRRQERVQVGRQTAGAALPRAACRRSGRCAAARPLPPLRRSGCAQRRTALIHQPHLTRGDL